MRWAPFLAMVATLASAGASAQPLAEDVAEKAGVAFVHAGFHAGPQRDRFAFYEATGGGACWGDLDNDDRMDLYVTDYLDPDLQGHARLYRNLGPDTNGTWRFEDVTEAQGVGLAGVGQACIWGDFDNDGWQDLYVTFAVTEFSAQRNVLFRNLGEGRGFTDVAEEAGLNGDATPGSGAPPCEPEVHVGDGRVIGRCWSTGAAWIDHDLDGDLDLYVAGYARFPAGACIHEFSGNPLFCKGQANRLYRNDGGTFTDVGLAAGVAYNEQGSLGRSLGVVASDLDGDAWPDLYVANDKDSNGLYLNNRDGTFRSVALAMNASNFGAVLDRDPEHRAGMGVDAQDVDGDGEVDLLSTHLRGEWDAVYLRRGEGWEDVAPWVGLRPVAEATSRWGGGFRDLDLDGDKDLLVVSGGQIPADTGPVHLLLQDDDGRFARQHGDAWPFAEEHHANHRAAAFADHDNDGDLDVYVSALAAWDGTPAVGKLLSFRAADDGGRWLRVTLEGTDNARDAFGAKVTVATDDGRTRHQWKVSGGSYLGHDDPRLLFGLGDARSGTVTVTWPGGEVQGPVPFDLGGGNGTQVHVVEDDRRAPAPVTVAPLGREGDGVLVSWTPSFVPDFAAYRVRAGGVVHEVTDRHATTLRVPAEAGDVWVEVVDEGGHVSARAAPPEEGRAPRLPLPVAGALAAVVVAVLLRRP